MTNPPRPDAILQEISRLSAAGLGAEAERLARAWLADHPGAPPALNALAVVLAKRGAFAEAEGFARSAVAAAPAEAVFQSVLGHVLYRKGDLAGAARAYGAAVALRPGHADWLHNLGIVRAAQGRHEEALAAQRAAQAAGPHRWHAAMEAAALLRKLGHDSQALAAYEDVITAAPDYVPAHQEYTDLAWSLGHDIGGLKSYAFARARVGPRPDLMLAEAETRLRLNQAAPAAELLIQARELAPQDADIANALARALAMRGQKDEARAEFARTLALAPQMVAHRRDFGTFLLAIHDFAAARDMLEPALELAPRDQSILACLALARRLLGDAGWQRLMDVELVREVHLPVPRGFADTASFHHALAEELTARHTHRVAPLDQTLRGGTQTSGRLFDNPSRAVGLLREGIARALEDHVAALSPDAAHPFLSRAGQGFGFAGSWSSCLAPGGFHTNHVHPSGWISSAYYVALPDGEEGALQFGQSQFLLGADDEPLRVVKPAAGKLVLFPSYFWHGTVPFHAAGRRLTVAFDVAAET